MNTKKPCSETETKTVTLMGGSLFFCSVYGEQGEACVTAPGKCPFLCRGALLLVERQSTSKGFSVMVLKSSSITLWYYKKARNLQAYWLDYNLLHAALLLTYHDMRMIW